MNEAKNNPVHLAAGSVRKTGKRSPKFAAEPVSEPDLSVEKINPLKKTEVLFRFIFITILVTVFSIVSSLAILGLTLLPIVKVGGAHWLIKKSSYAQGEAPIGATVFNLGHPIQRTLSSGFQLMTSGDSSGSIVSILALPLSAVSTTANNQVVINNKVTPYYAATHIIKHTLGDSYLVVCLKGACLRENTVIEIPTNQILGKVLGEVSLSLKLGTVPHPVGGLHVKP